MSLGPQSPKAQVGKKGVEIVLDSMCVCGRGR